MSPTDRLIESAGWMFLVLLWGLALYFYLALPETIPTHFNIRGEADDYGHKMTIFLLPAIATVATIGMTWLSRYPGKFNYPVKITEENVVRQQALALRMIRTLKMSINLVFVLVIYQVHLSVAQKDHRFAPLMPVLIMVFTMVPLVLYLVRAMRKH